MEPITFLIYASIIFLIIIGILLTLVLFRLYMILSKIDSVINYVDHIRSILSMWEQIPMKLLEKWLGK